MFEYSPGNHEWNLAVVATPERGGLIDEVDRACRPIREAAEGHPPQHCRTDAVQRRPQPKPTYRRVLEPAQRSFALQDPASQPSWSC